jgi:hypothetical protein
MTVAPVVAIEDADGNLASGASNVVQLTISANPGNGSFIGTTTVVAAGGVATFAHISINAPGNGYTITASSGTLTPATSAPFNMAYQTNGQFTSINVGASSSRRRRRRRPRCRADSPSPASHREACSTTLAASRPPERRTAGATTTMASSESGTNRTAPFRWR